MTEKGSPAVVAFVQQRIDAMLCRPDGWGPPHAVELQVLLLVEIRHLANGSLDRVDGVTERWVRHLGRTLPGSPRPLALRLGLGEEANDTFIKILRAFVQEEQDATQEPE